MKFLQCGKTSVIELQIRSADCVGLIPSKVNLSWNPRFILFKAIPDLSKYENGLACEYPTLTRVVHPAEVEPIRHPCLEWSLESGHQTYAVISSVRSYSIPT